MGSLRRPCSRGFAIASSSSRGTIRAAAASACGSRTASAAMPVHRGVCCRGHRKATAIRFCHLPLRGQGHNGRRRYGRLDSGPPPRTGAVTSARLSGRTPRVLHRRRSQPQPGVHPRRSAFPRWSKRSGKIPDFLDAGSSSVPGHRIPCGSSVRN